MTFLFVIPDSGGFKGDALIVPWGEKSSELSTTAGVQETKKRSKGEDKHCAQACKVGRKLSHLISVKMTLAHEIQGFVISLLK